MRTTIFILLILLSSKVYSQQDNFKFFFEQELWARKHMNNINYSKYPSTPLFDIYRSINDSSRTKKIFPTIPDSIVVAENDYEDVYRLYCNEIVKFSLTADYLSNGRLEKALSSLNQSRLYGFYKIFSHSEGDTLNRMKYARVLNVDKSKGLKLKLPKYWEKQLQNESIKRIWLEFAIRVLNDSTPIGLPLHYAVPIAIETDKNYYTITKTFTIWDGVSCGSIVGYPKKTFLLKDPEKTINCSKNLVDQYVIKLRNTFQQHPFNAKEITLEELPGELIFKTTKRPSDITSNMYWEICTYSIKWYAMGEKASDAFFGKEMGFYAGKIDDAFNSILVKYSVDSYLSNGPNDDFIFNHRYDKLYKEEIDKTMIKILKNICDIFNGKVLNGQCMCNCK